MSFDPRDPRSSNASEGFDLPPTSGSSRSGSQGASRGGRQPDARPDDEPSGFRDEDSSWSGGRGRGTDPSQVADWIPRGRRSSTFLGLPLPLIYVLCVGVIGLVFIGAVCARPTANGSVAGQIEQLSTDHQVSSLAGAQIVLRGSNNTYTAVSTDVPAGASGDAAYNYHLDNVPTGTYTMAVTPPAGANLQPEDNITLKVESGQLYPQSVMLLADGIQKPRLLSPSELQPGQTGYINDKGERVVYQQGSGFSATDALLLYLLWRNPPSFGYGAPPIIIPNPGGFSTGTSGTASTPSYRVDPPPTTSRTGQTVTQRPPSVPGQGSTRPSSSTGASGATGAGPSYSSGSSSSGSSGVTTGSGSSGPSGATTNRPSGGGISAPSQGVSRPSSSGASRPSISVPSRSSGSSSGGRR